MMTSTPTLSQWTPGNLAFFFLAATLYQGTHDSKHKFWNIMSTERYILRMQVLSTYIHIIWYAFILKSRLKKSKGRATKLAEQRTGKW